MAQTPASKLQDELKKAVQSSGGQYRKVRWEGRRGCPDCFVWWEWPSVAFVEIKAEYARGRDRYSALQRREVERMRAAGIPVYTVGSVEEIGGLVKKLKKQGCNL